MRPLVRIQFPVTLAYALSISSSQGRFFDSVGIYLDKRSSLHGMLHVAMSRVRTNPQKTCESDRDPGGINLTMRRPGVPTGQSNQHHNC